MNNFAKLLTISLLIALLLSTSVQGFRSSKGKKGKEPPKPKPKPKPIRINDAILPKYETFLEELQLYKYLPNFIKLGFVDTKHILRSTDMDYRMLQYDTEITTEEIDRLKAAIKEWLAKATMPDEKPKDPGYEDRKKLRYGRIYFPNAVQTVEYLIASFGSPPPIGLLPVVLSKTEYGCNSSLGDETAPEDVEEDVVGAILVVKRGGCSFLQKAQEAHRRQARAIIIVNNEDRLESPSSGLGIEANITESSVTAVASVTIVSVANSSWATFVHNHRLASHEETKSMAQMIPLKCVAGGKCFPLVDEEKSVQSEISAGSLRLRNSAGEVKSFEFLTSTFGGNLPSESFPVHISSPLDACSEVNVSGALPGSALLSIRGHCAFDQKAFHIEQAGSSLQIIIDGNDTALQRIGGALPGAGYVGIPTIYAVAPAGDFIRSSITRGYSINGHITGYSDPTISNYWIELSYAEWSDDANDRLVQLEGHLQKHLLVKNVDIIAWIRRQIDKVLEEKSSVASAIASEEL